MPPLPPHSLYAAWDYMVLGVGHVLLADSVDDYPCVSNSGPIQRVTVVVAHTHKTVHDPRKWQNAGFFSTPLFLNGTKF